MKDKRPLAKGLNVMTGDSLKTGLIIAMACMGGWLLIQLLMCILCYDIKRVLRARNTTAYEYLKSDKFWKSKSGRCVWYLKGPGLSLLVGKLLKMARMEVRETNFRSNRDLYNQCSSCIFLIDCQQKYEVSCQHCSFVKTCQLYRSKTNERICKAFKCTKWIEND